jgi:hypothetical protein
MLTYMMRSPVQDLSTLASGSVIFALNNLSTTKAAFVKRLLATLGFVGTAAATGIEFALARATGTAAAGSGSASGANIARKGAGSPNPFCTVFWGPTAITGLTPDTPGDFFSTFLNHQVGSPLAVEMIREDLREDFAEEFSLAPSTSLIVITRTISIAGSRAAFAIEWGEPN